MANQTIYTVGGTVQAGGGIYIPRKADDELLGYCRAGEFAFILSSRQVGKSSLMVRTAQQLEKVGIRSGIIDLSSIGVNISADEWYLGILNEVANTLELQTDIFDWWAERAALSPATRMTNFFRDVLLKELTESVVVFFDEIDSTLSIPFADDFFAALRAIYNARSTIADFKRLSFVMIGVATPSDLIADDKRTPFNVGHRVDLTDFTPKEAQPLAGDLGAEILGWVFNWTSGHPYLTQRLCAYLSKSDLKSDLQEETVADAVKQLFEGEQGWQDNNLQFVRDMLTKRSPNLSHVLKTYKDIRSGKKVIDDERSIAKSHLKISGVIRSEDGFLQPRNQIYENVFNVNWTQENIPKNWQKVALISLSAILMILVLGTLSLFINDYLVGSRIDSHFRNFISAPSSPQKLSELAGIYNEEGILSNKDSSLTASQLFYGLSSAKDQRALFMFTPDDIEQNSGLQNDLVVVISHLYITAANVDPKDDNSELLRTMQDALVNIPDSQIAMDLKNEIVAWLDGRKKFSNRNYQDALASYSIALSLNPGNHAVLYERAKVYVALGQYANALQDLDTTIGFAKQALPDIATPTVNPLPSTTATPRLIEVQTKTPFTTPSLGSTVLNSVGLTPTKVTPTMAIFALTPLPTSTPLPTQVRTASFESNFITLIDVINAVQALIKKTPQQFQNVVQSNPDNTYANLQLYNLIVVASPTPALVPSSTLFFTEATLLTMTPTENLISTVIPSETPLIPTETPTAFPAPLNYFPIIAFEDQPLLTEFKFCWNNEVIPSSELRAPEGFNRKIDNTWWLFNTSDGRAAEESVKANFADCANNKSVNAMALNTWVTQIQPETENVSGSEFGIFLQGINGFVREYLLWVDKNEKLHLRIRENAQVVYDDTVLLVNMQSSGRGNVFRQFRIQMFLEVDNHGSVILYLSEADSSPAGVQDLNPNQMMRIDAATLPRLDNLQNFGLIGRGSSTEVLIWPLVLFGE